MSSYHSPSDISRIAQAYEALRRDRCERIQEISRQNKFWMMSDGPEQEARDINVAKASEAQRRRIEDGTAWEPKPEKDMNAPHSSPEALMWLCGYDGIGEAREYLREVNGVME